MKSGGCLIPFTFFGDVGPFPFEEVNDHGATVGEVRLGDVASHRGHSNEEKSYEPTEHLACSIEKIDNQCNTTFSKGIVLRKKEDL